MEQHQRVMRTRNRRGVAPISTLGALFLAAAIASGQVQVSPPDIEPEFLAPLENQTVTQGREVHFTCVVNHLGPYKVAWIKSDSKAILAIHTHLVAHNPRLSVTHNGHNTWKLHVANVQKNDSGTYMCQINTDPMRSQMGHLDVVIPPDILNDENSGDGGVAPEGGSVRLRCHATGIPEPRVSWKREDGRNITLRHDGTRERLEGYKVFHGPTLLLSSIQRYDMGGYLCIASNGVPPTVSKRFDVQVHFHPLIKVSNQLVAAPVESDVDVQCYVEASPKAMNSWFKDTGEKLLEGDKYIIEEEIINEYALWLSLTIKNLEKKDFGSYVCASVNALGKVEGTIRLQELQLTAKTTAMPAPAARPEVKPARKKPSPQQHKNRKRKQRPKSDTDSDEDDDEAMYDIVTTVSWLVEPKTSLTINPSRPSSLWVPRQNEVALSSACPLWPSLPGAVATSAIITLWATRGLH